MSVTSSKNAEIQSKFRLVSQIKRVRLPKQKMVPAQKLYKTIAHKVSFIAEHLKYFRSHDNMSVTSSKNAEFHSTFR